MKKCGAVLASALILIFLVHLPQAKGDEFRKANEEFACIVMSYWFTEMGYEEITDRNTKIASDCRDVFGYKLEQWAVDKVIKVIDTRDVQIIKEELGEVQYEIFRKVTYSSVSAISAADALAIKTIPMK